MNFRTPAYYRTLFLLAPLLVLATEPASAGRGLLLNAYGQEQYGMAGADIALARDSHAVNNNPAGLTQIDNKHASGFVFLYGAPAASYQDELGNDEGLSDPYGAIFGASAATRLTHLPDTVAAIGLYVQGGFGIGHDQLHTRVGTRDEISANIAYNKLVAGLGWKARDNLSLGLSLGIGLSQGRQQQLPNTSDFSDPDNPVIGARFDGGEGVSLGAIVGVQYQATPDWTLALSYTSQNQLRLSGGTTTLNLEGAGLGRVKYARARLDGLALPQTWDLGVAWRLRPEWIVVAEYNWVNYSAALSNTRLRATMPNTAGAEPVLDAVTPLNWRDQHVYALGVTYERDANTSVRGGLLGMSDPIRKSSASPSLNVYQKLGVMGGFQRRWSNQWAFDLVLEYQLRQDSHYSNPGLNLGTQSTNRYATVVMVVGLSRSW